MKRKLILISLISLLFALPLFASAQTENCDFQKPEQFNFDAKFLATRKNGKVEPGEVFETKIYIKNTGNTPWFSEDSACAWPKINLGTDNDRDRNSPFHTNTLMWDSNWKQPNRIKMSSSRVNPGEIAEFTFWSRAPQKDGFFREYYTPVVEGVKWMENAKTKSDLIVGTGNINPENKDLLQYIDKSLDLSEINLEGDKNILVDISDQKMWLRVGDLSIREFPVSTGTYRTPTPIGETRIINKQEVRVGSAWPHYIMPKWMMFRHGGYGIHALPSLGNDNGVFWREALNHIGTRRSHGCIRLLPWDAEYAYDFAEVGTPVKVQY
ncbi:L,D-transpeptidase family protein [Candidatus Peregrinibacteria bacterium]|nr:L,D-transpeptidase family protein [Candidatus Peregrinibacteria bacterium]